MSSHVNGEVLQAEIVQRGALTLIGAGELEEFQAWPYAEPHETHMDDAGSTRHAELAFNILAGHGRIAGLLHIVDGGRPKGCFKEACGGFDVGHGHTDMIDAPHADGVRARGRCGRRQELLTRGGDVQLGGGGSCASGGHGALEKP
jgi:hypothetical protein